MRFRLPALFLLLLISATSGLSQDQVKGSLVSLRTGVQPGSTFTVALRLEHLPHWHTYWVNPGTGYPTSIEWDLPEGWTTGEIQWPTPIIIRDSHGSITGNGYEEVAYLPLELTAPGNLAPGSSVTLKGHADWLMCADVCIPGDSAIELTLPVVDSAAPVDSTHGEAIQNALESQRGLPDGVSLTAIKTGDTITLQLGGLSGPVTLSLIHI